MNVMSENFGEDKHKK